MSLREKKFHEALDAATTLIDTRAFPTTTATMKVLYFPIKARNVLAQLVAEKGGVECALETPAWPEYKGETVFGQLPQLEWDGQKLAQSMAIVRCIARKANLDGKTDEEFHASEMLLELSVECYDALKAAFVYEKMGVPVEKLDELKATLKKLFGHMERFVDASRGTAGDLGVIASCVVCEEFGLDELLADTPKVKAYYDSEKATIDKLFGSFGAWFKPCQAAA